MRSFHISRDWPSLVGLLFALLLAGAPLQAADAPGASGVNLKLSKVKFSTLIEMLSAQTNQQIVLQKDVDTVVDVDFPIETPVETILTSVSKTVGLDCWKEGDTFMIGKRPEIAAVPPEITAVPATSAFPRIPTADPAPAPASNDFLSPAPRHEATDTKAKPLVRTLELKHTPIMELLWALGDPSARVGNPQRERVMEQRIRTVVGTRSHFNVNGTTPDMGAARQSAPWLDNYVNSRYNRSGQTNAYQGPGGGVIGGTRPGGLPRPGGGVTNPAPGTGAGGTATDPNAPGGANQSRLQDGPLSSFIPVGIFDIVGLIGLNSLLVRADSEEAIEQLEQLIKLLDQPVKQVIVEVMFVKMEVKDAFALGVSWEYAGMPISVISSNGGSEGNFAVRYIKGSLKVALATLLTQSRAKVVNAPRVIVPNNSGGSVNITDSIPFVVVSEETDVFGRTVQTPEIDMQEFTQGLTVNNVTIHPDETITLDLYPELEAPGAGVGIPGGAGSVSASTIFDVNTIVRVKNGETIMMGGFVSKNEAAGGTRAPLLSDLPIIGPLLFRNKTHSTSNTETLVFVTPTIMKEDTTDFGGMATLPPLF